MTWTASDDAIVRRRYADEPTWAIAADLGRSMGAVYRRAYALGLRKSKKYLAGPLSGRTQPGSQRGIGGRFQKGQVPANKGLRRPGWGPGRMKATQFKPGNRTGKAAQNWCPIGTIRTDHEGYQRIKVRDAAPGEHSGFGNVRVWPLMQRWVWAQAHGPIPAGHAICFKDGDRANCDLSNLKLVHRADLMRRNSIHNLPESLKSTIRVLGAVNRQIRKRTHGQEQDR